MRCPACEAALPDVAVAKFCPECGEALPDEPVTDPLTGLTIGGRYTVSNLVAEGGMGRIYAADQTMGASSRQVAIKMLLAEYATNEQDVARFMRECSTVVELEHPNTIKFYDYGQTDDGDLFIVMEYLTGKSLAAEIRDEGAMAPDRVDWILSQVAGSLHEAHRKGIIHRDLKPDNILLTTPAGEPDVVKVLDFGIAKRPRDREKRLTPLGVVLGSPPYMSPEQFSLQDIDERSDIYSLGVVTYQCLTGELPLKARDMLQWATLHMTEPPRSFESTDAGLAVPLNMREAVMRALAKDPRDRPQTVREFYDQLTIGAGKSLVPPRLRSAIPSAIAMPPPPAEVPVDAAGDAVPPDRIRRAAEPTEQRAASVSDNAIPSLALNAGTPSGAPSFSAADAGTARPGLPPTVDATAEAPQAGAGPGPRGTQALDSSHPPADPRPPVGKGARVTVPELVPPTVRDPAGGAAIGGFSGDRDRRPAIFVVMVLAACVVAAALVITRVFVQPADDPAADEDNGEKKKKRVKDEPDESDPRPDPAWSALAIPSAPPSATSAPIGPIDPCVAGVEAALRTECELASRLLRQCPGEHPDHALAHRAFERRCGADKKVH